MTGHKVLTLTLAAEVFNSAGRISEVFDLPEGATFVSADWAVTERGENVCRVTFIEPIEETG